MNMENFNNHGLGAINSRVCMALALDDFDDEVVLNIKSKQVQNRDYTKEWLDCISYLKKVYSNGGLTEEEQDFVISHLPVYKNINSEKVDEPIPAEVIAHFCNVIDSNKKFPELYQADKTETKKELCIRFAKEDELPKAEVGDLPSMEYFGYYDSKENQIILFPERIKNAPTMLEKKGIHVTSKALYGMVFIHALSHALLDMISKIDTQESQFMDESIATMMTLFYYSQTKPNSNQYKTLEEWFPIQSNACMAGFEQFKMFENDKGLMKKYWAAWMARKSKITQK